MRLAKNTPSGFSTRWGQFFYRGRCRGGPGRDEPGFFGAKGCIFCRGHRFRWGSNRSRSRFGIFLGAGQKPRLLPVKQRVFDIGSRNTQGLRHFFFLHRVPGMAQKIEQHLQLDSARQAHMRVH